MKVEFNNFRRQYEHLKNDIINAIHNVLKSGFYILGEEVNSFEKEFSYYIGAKYCVGVANGLEALQIALLALGIGDGDEVITTSLSAAASALAIKHVGAKPIFVDIDDYFTINVDEIVKKITRRTRALIPVHLYGQPADMKAIKEIAKKYSLYVIEDCAQAHGAELSKKKVGIFGDVSCFSFYPTKNLGAVGDAGAIITNNKKVYEKCKILRNYGEKKKYVHTLCGLNSRLDEIQAAILRIYLRHLDSFNEKRINIAKRYYGLLADQKNIKLPKVRDNCKHVYHLFVIEAKNRDSLIKFLAKEGITTHVHYPMPLHKQKCFFRTVSYRLPNVEKRVRSIVSIPINPWLNEEEIAYICERINYFYGK